MLGKINGGVHAAVGTRHSSGCLDEEAFAACLEYLMIRGICGFAINGVTGELQPLPLVSRESRSRHLRHRLGRYSRSPGQLRDRSEGRRQDAIIAHAALLSLSADGPRSLLPHGGGKHVREQALLEGCRDGVISGIASVLPELVLSLYNEASTPNSQSFADWAAALSEFIEEIQCFPVPWGFKFTGEVLGIVPASFSQVLSSERRAQAETLKTWLLARQQAALRVA